MRKERDREIELVIGRLEEDSQATRDECERVAENRIKCVMPPSIILNTATTNTEFTSFFAALPCLYVPSCGSAAGGVQTN